MNIKLFKKKKHKYWFGVNCSYTSTSTSGEQKKSLILEVEVKAIKAISGFIVQPPTGISGETWFTAAYKNAVSDTTWYCFLYLYDLRFIYY